MTREKITQHETPKFEDVARELGCDPDDPRVAQVLKAMAAQPPKPHERPSGGGKLRQRQPKKD